MKTIKLAIIAYLFTYSFGVSDTIYVPDDFPTIQGAVSDQSVVNGDIIIVRPGTYVENIDFLGKAITLKSESGPEVTIIDGNKAGSVVTFKSRENQNSFLEGFTITNGTGTLLNSYWEYVGGGIYCDESSPTIQYNKFTDNTANNGGGIGVVYESSPVITHNIVFMNSAYTASTKMGGGGGIAAAFDSNPKISNNEIFDNYSMAAGGGLVFGYSCDPEVKNNSIYANTANRYGGGMAIYGNTAGTFEKNLIMGNSALGTLGAGGIACRVESFPVIANNLIIGNSAVTIGGGIRCFHDAIPVIKNNLVYGNSANYSGGGIQCDSNASVTITNSILWNNEAPAGTEMWIGPGSGSAPDLTISYSDVEGGMASVYVDLGSTLNWGDGMIDADPLFLDPLNDDFHLTWLSPCINRGTNDGAPSDDIDGDPRPYMGTVDMGADEFTGVHPLASDGFSVSEVTGGTVNFTLTGGMDNNSRNYIILGGVTGTAPGTPLTGGTETLRLNWDPFTDMVLSLMNTTVFTDFLGTLDANGTATAQLNAPPVPGFAGVTMHYAYALNKPWDFVSNPVAIEIVP